MTTVKKKAPKEAPVETQEVSATAALAEDMNSIFGLLAKVSTDELAKREAAAKAVTAGKNDEEHFFGIKIERK